MFGQDLFLKNEMLIIKNQFKFHLKSRIGKSIETENRSVVAWGSGAEELDMVSIFGFVFLKIGEITACLYG